MPKLLSRSKHEEFESNSALQIINQKERRAKNARILGHCRNFAGLKNCKILQPAKIRSVAKLPPLCTVHFSALLTVPGARLTFSFFVHFLVFFLLSPCNSVWICSFW